MVKLWRAITLLRHDLTARRGAIRSRTLPGHGAATSGRAERPAGRRGSRAPGRPLPGRRSQDRRPPLPAGGAAGPCASARSSGRAELLARAAGDLPSILQPASRRLSLALPRIDGGQRVPFVLMLAIGVLALLAQRAGESWGVPRSYTLLLAVSPALCVSAVSAMTDLPFLLFCAVAWLAGRDGARPPASPWGRRRSPNTSACSACPGAALRRPWRRPRSRRVAALFGAYARGASPGTARCVRAAGRFQEFGLRIRPGSRPPSWRAGPRRPASRTGLLRWSRGLSSLPSPWRSRGRSSSVTGRAAARAGEPLAPEAPLAAAGSATRRVSDLPAHGVLVLRAYSCVLSTSARHGISCRCPAAVASCAEGRPGRRLARGSPPDRLRRAGRRPSPPTRGVPNARGTRAATLPVAGSTPAAGASTGTRANAVSALPRGAAAPWRRSPSPRRSARFRRRRAGGHPRPAIRTRNSRHLLARRWTRRRRRTTTAAAGACFLRWRARRRARRDSARSDILAALEVRSRSRRRGHGHGRGDVQPRLVRRGGVHGAKTGRGARSCGQSVEAALRLPLPAGVRRVALRVIPGAGEPSVPWLRSATRAPSSTCPGWRSYPATVGDLNRGVTDVVLQPAGPSARAPDRGPS